MNELLTPIKTVKTVQSNIDKFNSLSIGDSSQPQSTGSTGRSKKSVLEIDGLRDNKVQGEDEDVFVIRTAQQTTTKPQPTPLNLLKKPKIRDSTIFHQKSYLNTPTGSSQTTTDTLPDDTKAILSSQPSREDLLAVLRYLDYGVKNRHDFNIHILGAKQSQIINTIVTTTIPDQWHVLRGGTVSGGDQKLKELLISPLRSVAGIGAILMQLRKVVDVKSAADGLVRDDLLSLLGHILAGPKTVHSFLLQHQKLYTTEAQQRTAWQEIVALLAGSKILSVAAQSLSSLDEVKINESFAWLGDGSKYCRWLAHSISYSAIQLQAAESPLWVMLAHVAKRALNLGFRDTFVSELYTSFLLGSRALWTPLHQLLSNLTAHEQKMIFDTILRDSARKYLRPEQFSAMEKDRNTRSNLAVGGVAAMVSGLAQSNSILDEHISQWLTNTTGEYAGLDLDVRRAVVATLARHEDKLRHILGKNVMSVSDKMQIQHQPILQQEATTQIILLTLGYLHRHNPAVIRELSRSGYFLQAVSNRLAASIPRARFLGMIIGVAVSRLVDPPEKVMDFGVEEMKTEEAQKWLNLVAVEDTIGDAEALRTLSFQVKSIAPELKSQPRPNKQHKSKATPRQPETKKIIAIEEIIDEKEEDDDDDDLVPYQKPDSDPSDSEEDPTLIERNKPSAPVYLIDLVKQLHINDKPDLVELALKTAPSLIRRKANFGKELSDIIHALLSALINLNDGMTKREMETSRLDAMIACLVAKPDVVGPWAASIYFEGDFNLVQLATLLSTLGLGAREMAGYKDTGFVPTTTNPNFATKRLPAHLEAVYAPLDSVARQIEHSTIQPMALAAADKVSGPDILKIRTFSSRMAVEKKTALKQQERSRTIPKKLHTLLADSLYLPLCCRMSLVLSSHANLSRSSIFEPHIMKLFFQTLIIVATSMGPNALQLQSVTRETLILLLGIHNIPRLVHDPVILPATLQLLLTLIDLNVSAGSTAEERLVTEFGEMMAELINWAASLNDTVSIPVSNNDGSEGMPWPVIVAGIQVKWHEIGKKFQGRMLGLMSGAGDDAF